jgi:hypothetical protein
MPINLSKEVLDSFNELKPYYKYSDIEPFTGEIVHSWNFKEWEPEMELVAMDLELGWHVRKTVDCNSIELTSPEGDKIVIVKNERTGGQDIVYRYFATLLYQKGLT